MKVGPISIQAIINILRVREAFSNPRIPHNPPWHMLVSDLEYETRLNQTELSEVLDILEKAQVVKIDRPPDFPATANVAEAYMRLMGV